LPGCVDVRVVQSAQEQRVVLESLMSQNLFVNLVFTF
jgi:hypothetical protein